MAKIDTLDFDDFRKLIGILEKLKLEKTSKKCPLLSFESVRRTVQNF